MGVAVIGPAVAAGGYRQLGLAAQDRGKLDEAQDLHAKFLSIKNELGSRLALAVGSGQLGPVVDKLGSMDEGVEPTALPY